MDEKQEDQSLGKVEVEIMESDLSVFERIALSLESIAATMACEHEAKHRAAAHQQQGMVQ